MPTNQAHDVVMGLIPFIRIAFLSFSAQKYGYT